MKPIRIALVLTLAAVALLALWPNPAGAVPVFARKYGFGCTNCHAGFPRLNDWGQRFRANGYQVPGRENEEKTVLEGPAPLSGRLGAGYLNATSRHGDDSPAQRGFRVHGLDVLSAGVIGPHVGYFLVYPPQIVGSRGVEAQEGTIEMASVVFRDLGSPLLNVRVGRFEPACAAFSVKRHLSFTPYEVYDYGPAGAVAFSETQEGVELAGGERGVSYAAGFVNGSSTNLAADGPTDVYARVAYVIGAGEGQTAGQRIGVTGYLGTARPEAAAGERKRFQRIGADASLNVRQVNLAAQWLYGSDDARFWDLLGGVFSGPPGDVTWSGLFTELSWQPLVECVGFARFDWVDTPEQHFAGDIMRWTGGARYYVAENLALHAEASRRIIDVDGGGDPTEDTITARVDFAF